MDFHADDWKPKMKPDPTLDPPFMLSEGVENGTMAILLGVAACLVLALSGFLLAIACGAEWAWRMVEIVRLFYDGAPK